MYLLTPFVDGGDVFEWIANSKDPYNEARTNLIRRLFRQLMQGLKVWWKTLFIDGMNNSCKAG